MLRMIILIEAKDGLSPQEFRDYYETNHAPMAMRLFPMTKDYRRTYLDRSAWETRGPGIPAPDADVITEMWFETEADYAAFLKRAAESEVLAEVLADEAKFLKQSTVRNILIDESKNAVRLPWMTAPK